MPATTRPIALSQSNAFSVGQTVIARDFGVWAPATVEIVGATLVLLKFHRPRTPIPSLWVDPHHDHFIDLETYAQMCLT